MSEFDLENFLKDGSVSNLDWLDVDETTYREMDVLPKQNLDIRPDLEALWAREGESPTAYLVPNISVPTPGIDKPKTMGDMSQAHGRLREEAEAIRKIARLALMQSNDPSKFKDELTKRFGLEPLQKHRTVLADVLKERGLLGRLYIAAEDFPSCDQGGKQAEFVQKYAGKARYVLAKKACEGCSYANKTPTGTHCGVFHKEIKLEVPYSDELADAIEQTQKCCGGCKTANPKERIRNAFLTPLTSRVKSRYEGQGIRRSVETPVQEVATHLAKSIEAAQEKQAEINARPIIAFLHREMVKGLSREELVKSLRIAFSTDLLTNTHKHWGPIFKEAGLYGVVYTKQASFDDCHKGADFLAKHNSGVRAIVAGEKCGSCIYNKIRCLLYGKSLIRNASEVITQDTVEAVLLEHRTAGRLPPMDDKIPWGDTPANALVAIHEATRNVSLPQIAPVRMGFMQGFHGQEVGPVTSGLTRRDIVRQASKYMNEGLYGQDLLEVLKTRFEVRDLVAAKAELQPVLAEQGLQGIFYINPTVYNDYGKGCEEAARLHRTRLVGYVKQGPKCGSCVNQVQNGFCSKINKQLVDEPPYVDKAAQQREVLASGRSMDVSYASLMNNGTSTLAEYQMQNPMTVEVREASVPDTTVIQFGAGKVKLS
jgi:hypothetical protein